MKPTIEQIANKVGVSISTVSRALNDNARISLETREKVKRQAYEMGFYDKMLDAVENLKETTPPNIGVSINDLTNPFCAEIINSIRDVGSMNGYRIIIMDANMDRDKEIDNIQNFKALGVKGIIIHPTRAEAHKYINQVDLTIPKVYICDQFERGDANFVCIDTKEAMYKSTEYLIQLGHRKIAFVGASERFFMRIEGYEDALKSYNVPIFPDDIIHCAPTRLSGYNAMHDIMASSRGYTAIVCVNDFVAFGVMEYIKKHGRSVPEDYSVVGFDNLDISGYNGIDLTTINQPRYEIGKLACEILIGKIKSGDLSNDTGRVLESYFVIRKSCR